MVANIEEKAHAGNATQNIHPTLMQDTHTHTTAHTASLIHLLVKIHERHTQSKGEDRSTALAWSMKQIPTMEMIMFRFYIYK